MNSVLSKSFKSSIKGKPIKFFFSSVSSFGFPFLVGKSAFNLTIGKSIVVGAIGLAILFIVRFIYFLSINGYEYYINKLRESVYGDAIVDLKDTFSKIHWLRKKAEKTDEDFMSTMAYTCEQLKLIFDRKTRSSCAVSIKLAIGGGGITSNTEVKNLCRDRQSRVRDTDAYNNTQHFVFSNTCYTIIFNNLTRGRKNKYYLNNDLSKAADYENTSVESYPDGILPYKSELVVPIIPLVNEQDKVYNLLGFLCVDSAEKSVLDDKYDLAILQGVADGIYDILHSRSN